jgi:hypothetical protein
MKKPGNLITFIRRQPRWRFGLVLLLRRVHTRAGGLMLASVFEHLMSPTSAGKQG